MLGGGGALGAAWLLGAVQGLVAATGWSPAESELVVGTSAGAVVGALVAEGIWPSPEGASRDRTLAGLREAARYRLVRRPALRIPGSRELVASAWRERPRSLPRLLAAIVPWGWVSTEPIERFVEEALPGGWPRGARLWVVATDYGTGLAVPFGSPDLAAAPLPRAVAASCAMPGFYRPVEIGGRLYVDGAVGSGPGLRLVAGRGLDLVLCLNPGSSSVPGGGVFLPALRARLHEELAAQVRAVEAAGTRVITLEPDARLGRMIGLNPMRRRTLLRVGGEAAAAVEQEVRRRGVGRELGRPGTTPRAV